LAEQGEIAGPDAPARAGEQAQHRWVGCDVLDDFEQRQ
jgi:hypothetical protein